MKFEFVRTDDFNEMIEYNKQLFSDKKMLALSFLFTPIIYLFLVLVIACFG